MSFYDGLPSEVSERVRIGIQIIPVSTPALKGVMFYQPPQMVLETDRAFGTEFHRGSYPWLAAYLVDTFGRLRFCERSETVDARPLDGRPFALTLAQGQAAPLPTERPAGLALDATGVYPGFLETWVGDALSHDRGCPGKVDPAAWQKTLLDRCGQEASHAIETLVRPLLNDEERDAWALMEAAERYDGTIHEALRADTKEAACLRAYARRQPFFCAEILCYEPARLAVLKGATDREVAAVARALARGAKAEGYIRLLPPAHIVALGKRPHRIGGHYLHEVFRWYAGLPLEWLPTSR